MRCFGKPSYPCLLTCEHSKAKHLYWSIHLSEMREVAVFFCHNHFTSSETFMNSLPRACKTYIFYFLCWSYYHMAIRVWLYFSVVDFTSSFH